MKGIQSIIMTLVLLMVAGTAGAQSEFKRTITRQGQTIEYSISGVKVTKEEQPLYTGNTPERGNYMQNYEGTVESGKTITVKCRQVKGNKVPIIYFDIRYYDRPSMSGAPLTDESMRTDKEKATSSRVPKRKYGEVKIYYLGDTGDWITVTWNLDIDATPVPVSVPTPVVRTPVVRTPEPEKGPCEKIDSRIRFNDFYGEVKKRCNFEEDDSYEFVDLDDVVYENDRIKTEEESGAILGLEDMSTYVIKPKSVLIIHSEEENESKLEMLIGRMWTNIKKVAAGKSIGFEMSHCVCGINGTIVAFEETGGKSDIYLFAGSVTVTSKKGTDKVNLQPGQTSSVGSNGKVAVKEFDIEKGAKKFGISMDDIRNHYSNAGTTGNVGLVFTENKLNYKILSGNTVELTSELKGNYSGYVKIPSVVKHSGVTYQVVGIGKRAFADQTKMKSVDIPASVRSIEEDAFYNTGLASVAVPGNNANVQRHAFRNCRVLTTAIISGKNAYCHPEAFADCNYLQDLRIESPTSTPTTNRSTQTTTTTPQGGVKVSSPGKYSFTLPTNNR